MKTTVDQLFEMAADLTEADRATLAGLLVDTLATQADPAVEAAWRVEISRRIEEIRSGKVKLIQWENVKTELHALICGA